VKKVIYPETWSLIVASNSDDVLRNNLLGSDEVNTAKEILIERDEASAAYAYNSGIDKTTGNIMVFAHQDVFLPPEWSKKMLLAVAELTAYDPNWGAAGLYGITETGEGAGFVYSTGLMRFVGEAFHAPIRVRSIDEMVIIMRRSSGLKFDENLPGFHLYGTDICMEAESLGMQNYVLPCFALHNSVGIMYLPWSFWKAYFFLRNKWKMRLPIITPCTTITYGSMPILRHFAEVLLAAVRKKKKLGSRVNDPSRFYGDSIGPALNS